MAGMAFHITTRISDPSNRVSSTEPHIHPQGKSLTKGVWGFRGGFPCVPHLCAYSLCLSCRGFGGASIFFILCCVGGYRATYLVLTLPCPRSVGFNSVAEVLFSPRLLPPTEAPKPSPALITSATKCLIFEDHVCGTVGRGTRF